MNVPEALGGLREGFKLLSERVSVLWLSIIHSACITGSKSIVGVKVRQERQPPPAREAAQARDVKQVFDYATPGRGKFHASHQPHSQKSQHIGERWQLVSSYVVLPSSSLLSSADLSPLVSSADKREALGNQDLYELIQDLHIGTIDFAALKDGAHDLITGLEKTYAPLARKYRRRKWLVALSARCAEPSSSWEASFFSVTPRAASLT